MDEMKTLEVLTVRLKFESPLRGGNHSLRPRPADDIPAVYVSNVSEESHSKMPAQNLLEINPNELFEKHSIAEIKSIQIQIQNEVEKKREELRTMVGEKCRDLLKAADTITEMKGTAQNVIVGVNRMKELCQNLQEKRVSGFRPQNNTSNVKSSNKAEDISKIIEIKILLSIPEQIWTAIDNKDYLLGAQLFLFATHLHLGLEVSSSAQKISQKFPVVTKQWEIIRSCKKIIVDGSQSELKVNNLPHQKAAECLGSLVLLEVMSYEKLMAQFLDLRMSSLEEILRSEELSRKKLRLMVELLQNTLVVLYVCFLEKPGKQCAIQAQLNQITGEEGKPTLSKTVQVSSLPERYLSPLIINYRPKTPSTLSPLPPEYIKTTLVKWLEKVEKVLQVEITKLLLLIDDIKRLHKIIKAEVFSLGYPQHWDEMVEALLDNNTLDIYERFIKSYVTKRIKDLIEITWESNMNRVLACLTKMDEEALKERKKQPENDIRWFVWKENKVDTEEGLKLKTLGFTSRVMELCGLMNAFLSGLLDDVNLYVGEDTSSKSKPNTGDADFILPFLNLCSFDMLKRFTKNVKESYREREDGNNESNIIIRARFLSSLTTLCPSLEKCLKQIHTFEQDFNDSKTGNTWQEAIVFLNEESTLMWDVWRAFKTAKLRQLIKAKLHPIVSLRNLLQSKPLSEIITIEEQTEDDKTVKSELRVPSQPSLPLQELLFLICQQLNAVAPHTLPSRIHQNLVDDLARDILKHYEGWSNSEVIYQSQAWQMLLDIRFLTLLVVTTENKDLSQSICEVLEKKIDPFDLDVYFPHLQNSVKKSTLKLQGTFGVLINFTEKLPVFNGLKLSQSNSKVEEPNLLAASSNVPWFPLLPVTNFGSRRSDPSRFDGQDPSSYKDFTTGKATGKEKENKKESVTSDFFKSAGAFFDAVTGGWS